MRFVKEGIFNTYLFGWELSKSPPKPASLEVLYRILQWSINFCSSKILSSIEAHILNTLNSKLDSPYLFQGLCKKMQWCIFLFKYDL